MAGVAKSPTNDLKSFENACIFYTNRRPFIIRDVDICRRWSPWGACNPAPMDVFGTAFLLEGAFKPAITDIRNNSLSVCNVFPSFSLASSTSPLWAIGLSLTSGVGVREWCQQDSRWGGLKQLAKDDKINILKEPGPETRASGSSSLLWKSQWTWGMPVNY